MTLIALGLGIRHPDEILSIMRPNEKLVGEPIRSVIIVGGGIAGAALGHGLATAGLDVTILERTTEFVDRVRGEIIQPWGVAEAQRLGIEQVLLDVGGRLVSTWRRYSGFGSTGEVDNCTVMPMDQFVSGVDGSLNIAHPTACQALLDAAEAADATIVRGVENIVIQPGSSPHIGWRSGGSDSSATPHLIVGADGRASTVRKQSGIEWQKRPATGCIAGLLIDGLDMIPDAFDVTASGNDLYLLMFRQTQNRARGYLAMGLSERHRFAGSEGPQNFLDACAELPYPWAQELAQGTPAGPCATVLGTDTWVDKPYEDGVLLVGDAAGFGDPILGQGLSAALRDARITRDLILDHASVSDHFAGYGDERAKRGECLRLISAVVSVLNAEDCTNRAARHQEFERLATDPNSLFLLLMLGAFTGPETVPEDAIDQSFLSKLRGK